MYDDMLLRLPENEADMWDLLEGQFEHIAMDFGRLRLETRWDALDNRFHEKEGYIRRDGLDVVRYRDVSDELDSRSHFWEMGRSLVAEVRGLIAAKRLTPVFVQQWGKLTFCHGYITAHVFDDSDDLGSKRGGAASAKKRSVDRQRKWIAHHLIPLIDAGLTRDEAEARIVENIEKLKKKAAKNSEEHKFLARMITRGGLASTYNSDHFYVVAMRQLLLEPTDDIPTITSLTP